MCRTPFPGQKVKGQGHRSTCSLHGSVPIWLIHFICGTHTSHEVVMCRTPFAGQKVKGQGHNGHSKFLPCPLCGSIPIWPIHFLCGTHIPWGDNMLCTICGSKGQRTRSHGLFKCFAMSASCLGPYLTNAALWGDDVLCPISGSKGQRSRSHGSLEVFAMFVLWVCPCWTHSLHGTHTTHKVTDVSCTICWTKG